MAHPVGEPKSDVPRLNFDRRLKLEFHGSSVTSDAGLMPLRELDDMLGLMVIAGQTLADGRTGRNSRHNLIGMLRQSVFGRVAGYEDVNDPAMRWIVGGRAAAASTSQMAATSSSRWPEVPVPRELFHEILRLIAELRQQPPPAPCVRCPTVMR